MNEEEVDRLVEQLLSGGGEYVAEEWEDEVEEEKEPAWRTTLLECVDRHKELRDDNFVSPYELLLYTEETDTLESVELKDLALRHPWEEKDGRWQSRDVGALLKTKLTLWRQSVVANELVEEGVSGQLCATVVLCVPKDKGLPFSWVVVNAKTLPKGG